MRVVAPLIHFNWSQFKIALQGESPIDLPALYLQDRAEARRFLLSYGYDYEDLQVREEIWRIYFEAVSFIRTHLLEEKEQIPEQYLTRSSQTDILRLLVEASKTRGWPCAILRVMHIISHLDNDVRIQSFQYAREQIFARFDALIQPAEKRRWKILHAKHSIPLVRYIKKLRKERGSHIIKLLSKPEALAEGIYDSLGLRFVTENRVDAYRLLQIFFDTGVISSVHIQPARSLNSLIPLDVLKDTVSEIEGLVKAGQISSSQIKKMFDKLEQDFATGLNVGVGRNPFSSKWYRAIQFTGRQLISAPDPTYSFWQQVKQAVEKSPVAQKALEKVPVSVREKQTFYYPFEVQIMDLESYVESIGGRSRHREYKAKQRLMARNRVLRDLV